MIKLFVVFVILSFSFISFGGQPKEEIVSEETIVEWFQQYHEISISLLPWLKGNNNDKSLVEFLESRKLDDFINLTEKNLLATWSNERHSLSKCDLAEIHSEAKLVKEILTDYKLCANNKGCNTQILHRETAKITFVELNEPMRLCRNTFE